MSPVPALPGGHVPHLVALDVDGTLVTYAGELSEDARDAVAQVRAEGHHVVLATGRSVHATVPVAHDLGIVDGWLVCSNGSVTVRLNPDAEDGYEVVDQVTFDPAPALRLLHAELPGALFAVEEVGVGFRLNAPFPEGELSGVQSVVDLDDLCSTHVTRLVVRSPGQTSEEFHEVVHRMGLADVSYAIGWTAWMDIAPHGVTKASALEQLRRRLEVEPGATIAVGDGGNDCEMLEWAARGVAMGHADARVREVADEVTGTIEDDGVVALLRSLLA